MEKNYLNNKYSIFGVISAFLSGLTLIFAVLITYLIKFDFIKYDLADLFVLFLLLLLPLFSSFTCFIGIRGLFDKEKKQFFSVMGIVLSVIIFTVSLIAWIQIIYFFSSFKSFID